MSKKSLILMAAMATIFFVYNTASMAAVPGPFGYSLYDDIYRDENAPKEDKTNNEADTQEQVPIVPKTAKDFYSFVPMKDLYVSSIDSTKYYANPSMKSAIYRYKIGNYTGCLQELYSYIKNPRNVNDAYAYYYMGLAYAKIGESTAAQNCFQKTINCDAKGKLLELAVKGRDCISGGAYCHEPINPIQGSGSEIENSLDEFINAPYSGNGFSPEAERDYQQRKLRNMQKKMNAKDSLDRDDYRDMNNINNQKKK